MLREIIFVLSVLALARAQIPSLGFCPEYVPMANFDMERFMGLWYEAERYFQLSEVVSRCVLANYTKGSDGKYRVSNEVTNRFTGIKRVLEGEIKAAASKAEEGKLHVKYTTVPLTPETKYSVLETDYSNYAVLWSCSGIGPVHTQNAWIMTRQRYPPGEILQKTYGVLDKYKISKTFFVKTDQEDCAYLASLPPTTEATASNENEEPQARIVPLRNVKPDAPNAITEPSPLLEKLPEKELLPVVSQNPESVKPLLEEKPFKEKLEEPVPAILPELILKKAELVKKNEAEKKPEISKETVEKSTEENKKMDS